MVWWIVVALVVVPLAVLAPLLLSVRDRAAELQRVAELTRERAESRAVALQAGSVRLKARLAEVSGRSAVVRRRLPRQGAEGARRRA